MILTIYARFIKVDGEKRSLEDVDKLLNLVGVNAVSEEIIPLGCTKTRLSTRCPFLGYVAVREEGGGELRKAGEEATWQGMVVKHVAERYLSEENVFLLLPVFKRDLLLVSETLINCHLLYYVVFVWVLRSCLMNLGLTTSPDSAEPLGDAKGSPSKRGISWSWTDGALGFETFHFISLHSRSLMLHLNMFSLILLLLNLLITNVHVPVLAQTCHST